MANETGNVALRDLFAAHALAGMCAAGVTTCDLGAPEVATLAYGYADAMLRARRQLKEEKTA